MTPGRKLRLARAQAMFMETFGLGRTVSLSAIILISVVILFAVFWFFYSAPPHTITITTGPEGSIFQTTAEKYRKILARDGMKTGRYALFVDIRHRGQINEVEVPVSAALKVRRIVSGSRISPTISTSGSSRSESRSACSKLGVSRPTSRCRR